MTNIIDSLKGFISPELVNQASSSLGESKGGVTSALGSAFPSLLGGMLNKSSDSSFMGNIFNMVKDHEGTPPVNSEQLASERGEKGGLIDQGKNLLSSVFGNKSNEIAGELGKSSGIKPSSAMSLLTLAGPMILGFLGKKVKTDGLNAGGLTSFLGSQKDNIVNALPPGLRNVIGVHKPEINEPVVEKRLEDRVPREERQRPAVHREHEHEGTNWKKWLVGALAVLLLFVVGGVFARHMKHKREMKKQQEMVMNRPAVTSVPLTKPAPNASDATAGEVVLPNGVRLNLPQNSVESRFLIFVKDKSKPASKETKFNLDGLRFEKNSTQLEPGSEAQLKNMAEIMKSYPAVAINVIGYTDNAGNTNFKLSKERANIIKSELAKMGAKGSSITTEGAENTGGAERANKSLVDIVVVKK